MAASDVTPDQLRQRLSGGEDLYLLDVREPDEVLEWAFPGAVNIPLGELGGAPRSSRPIARSWCCATRVCARRPPPTPSSAAGGRPPTSAGGAVAWVASES